MIEKDDNQIDTSSNNLKKGRKSVIVVGAGISGLAIGLKLCKEGFKVTILEKQNFVGGLVASIPYNGYKIELGPHIFLLPKKSKITDEIKELMCGEELIEIHHPWARSYFAGRLIDRSYPSLYDVIFRSGVKFFIFGIFGLIRAKLSYLKNKKQYKSAEDYFIDIYGKFLYNIWFKPYYSQKCGKLNDNPPELAEKIFHPLTNKRIKSFLLKKLFKKGTNKSQESFNCYPKFGMESFLNRIIREIESLNGTIILESKIESIEHENLLKKVYFNKNNKKLEISSDIIIYTVSIPIIMNWFEKIPNEVKLEVEKMQAFHSIMVFLLVNSPKLYNGWIITFYDNDFIIFRISQQSVLSSEIAPKGKTLLCIEIQARDTDPLWTIDEYTLIKNVKDDLKKAGILHEEKVEGHMIMKLRNVYPITTLSDSKDSSIIDFITSYQNEYVINAMIDPGLVSSSGKTDGIIDPTATGIYKAFINAEIIVKEIKSKFSV